MVLFLAQFVARGSDVLSQQLDLVGREVDGSILLRRDREQFAVRLGTLEDDVVLCLQGRLRSVALLLRQLALRFVALGTLPVVADRDQREQQGDAETFTEGVE